MAKSINTLQLPFALVELAKQHFKTANTSLAICSSIEFAIMHCKLPISDESCEIYHLICIEERRKTKSYSVRIEDYAVKALLSVSNQSLSEAVTTAIALTLSTDTNIASAQPLKLINILGSKWDKRMQSAIKQVIANRIWQNSYETCAGALGIHANFELAGTELINDDEIEKINLYTCIQQYAFEFKCKALTFECTESDFAKKKWRWFNMKTYPRFHKTTNEINHLLLLSMINCGSVCADKTLEENTMTLRTEIIAKHEEHHSIWQNKTTHKWCTKLGTEKRLLMRKERSDLENAIIEFYLSDKKLTTTVDEVFKDWCEYESARTEHTMKTINEYSNDYKRFLAKTDFVSRPIHDVREQDIVRVMKAIVYDGEKVPHKRYKSIKTIMRTIFNHARIHMDIECISVKNVMDDLRFPSTAFKETNTEDSKQVFKHSELKRLKEELKDTEDLRELGILLTLETGMRVGELCTLEREHVTENHLLIRQSEHRAKFGNKRRYYIGEPKKGKTRDIVLNEDAKRILQKILSLHDNNCLFPNPKDDSDWMRSYYFDHAIRKVCRRLGIPERSMHKLRKTYSSYILAQKDLGVTDKLAQEQLGHADISTTHQAYYYNIYDEEQQVNVLSSIRIG